MSMSTKREFMIEHHLRSRGIGDPRLLAAFNEVPREAFLPVELAEFAYDDRPLPIAAGQTISQPYIVALMTEALQLSPDDAVLEIGTGSGYAAAILSRMVRRVYTIERHAELADSASFRLDALGVDNVEVRCGDGTLGWPEQQPFAAIIAAAVLPPFPGTAPARYPPTVFAPEVRNPSLPAQSCDSAWAFAAMREASGALTATLPSRIAMRSPPARTSAILSAAGSTTALARPAGASTALIRASATATCASVSAIAEGITVSRAASGRSGSSPAISMLHTLVPCLAA